MPPSTTGSHRPRPADFPTPASTSSPSPRRLTGSTCRVALWGYGRLTLPGALDAPIEHFYADTVGPWWPPERALIEDAYRSLNFPFAEMGAPAFCIEVHWTLDRLLDYLSTWSAVKRYQAARDEDPLPPLRDELAPGWGDPTRPKALRWPLFLRAGRR